jgi:hypothetical protein
MQNIPTMDDQLKQMSEVLVERRQFDDFKTTTEEAIRIMQNKLAELDEAYGEEEETEDEESHSVSACGRPPSLGIESNEDE